MKHFLPITTIFSLALLHPIVATVWTDNDITHAINQRINRDMVASGFGLTVATKEGMVTLDGAVTNLYDKQRAERIAASRRGVRSVINVVRVDAGPIEDSSITKRVKEAFADDPAFDEQAIEIDTTNGIVNLSG